jgi:nuclear GTP-binding protein
VVEVKLTIQAVQPSGRQEVRSVAALAQTSQQSQRQADIMELAAASSSYDPQRLVDASLTVRDSSAKAFMRELRKVIERSDVIIQVLDARDPEGTRSRWVEDEVRRHDAQGKKLLGVVNKIGESSSLGAD